MRQNYKLTLIAAGCLPALAAMGLLAGEQAQASPLKSLQNKCAIWQNFPAPAPSMTVTMAEYEAWLREIERRNPHKTWQQTITFLHTEHQTGDEGLNLPFVGNTFVNGPENDGWQDRNFDTACYANTPTGRTERRTPYYVLDEFGRLIDLTHIYAGIRSDFNRDRSSWKADLMRRANTDWGDKFQNLVMPKAWTWKEGDWLPRWWGWTPPGGGYAPPDQLLGDTIGIRASDILRGLNGGPRSWAGVILQAIENSVREEALARDVADLLPTEDQLSGINTSPAEAAAEEKQKAAREAQDNRRDALCDPRNNPPKRTVGSVNEDGFIAMTEDYGAPDALPDGCEPYGPPAKRFEYEGPSGARPTTGESLPTCARLAGLVDIAGVQYASGEIKEAKASLERVERTLGDRTEACLDVKNRVIDNLGKINRLTNVVNELEHTLTTCEPNTLRRYHGQLTDAAHPKLVSLRDRLLRAVPVAESYTLAVAAYGEGRMDEAQRLLRGTLSLAKQTDGQTCTDILERTQTNLNRIDTAKDLEKAISDALERCDMPDIERRKAQLVGATNPFLVSLHGRLGRLPDRCIQFASNAHCQSTIGAGWTAGPPDDKGQYYCRPPSKAAANRWCEDHNEGSGWTAGAVASNGSFGCFPSYARQKNAALDDCRRQHGSRLIRVYRVDGQWYCSFQQKTAKRRTSAPHSRTARRQPSGYDPRAAAAAAAIAGAIMQGIAQSQGGRHGHTHGGNCAVNPRAPGC